MIGTTTVMLAERKPEWPFTPSLLQVYVDDAEATLDRALARGARLITKPTDFFGTTFVRIQDPSANIWWIWQHGEPTWGDTDWSEGTEESAEGEGGGAGGSDDSAWAGDAPAQDWAAISPELAYIHDTLLGAMSTLRDPKQD